MHWCFNREQRNLRSKETLVDELLIMRDLSAEQRMLFQSEMSRGRKDPTVALLLCLFLGGLGAHHFYMGNVGVGVLYLLFFWTFIPVIISFVELFLITQRVQNYNNRLAVEVWNKIKIFSNQASCPPSTGAVGRLFCSSCGAPMQTPASFCSSCGKAAVSV